MQQNKTDNPGRTTGLLVREGAKCSCSPFAWSPELSKAMCPVHGTDAKAVCPTCLCPACASGYHEDTVYGDFECDCPCHGRTK